MKFTLAFIALFFTTFVLAQESNKLNSQTNVSEPVHAIKRTAVVSGESFYVRRDKNNKFVFVKTIEKKLVHPIKVTIQ